MSYRPFEDSVFQEVTQNVHELAEAILKPMKSMESLTRTFEEYTHRYEEISDIVNRAMPESIRKALSFFDELGESIARVQEQYRRIFDSISIPSFDEQWLQKRRDSYEKWGEYGWTVIGWAPMKSFFTVPSSRADANATALSYCSDKQIESLFSDLLDKNGIKKTDLREAIDDFRSKRYKSCASVLFSIIDEILIRSMEKGKKKQRPSGKIAAEIINTKIENAVEVKGMIFHLLSWAGVFAALKVFFEPGTDFKQQPSVLGRNWLDHGMLHRLVKRMDCIQLFLLLENLIDMKDMLRRISKNCISDRV